MAEVRRKAHFHTEIRIAGGEEIGRKQLKSFEWKSFINGGYVIRAKIIDPDLRYFRDHLKIKDFLRDARRIPTEVRFKMLYPGASETEERIAYITDLDIYGSAQNAAFDFLLERLNQHLYIFFNIVQ